MEFILKTEFDRVRGLNIEPQQKLTLLSTMCRLNTLFSVKKAGSGHLGSSFSAMDIASFLYFHHMNFAADFKSPNRDLYFSSKGHDVPGQYSILFALGLIPEEKYLKLRRFGGLDGHPDVKIPGIEANSGSLGMGISKARGMSFAKKHFGNSGRVIVMVGDGEFQEGQNFEALQATVQQGITNLTVVMDHNKLQSDRLVDRIVSLGDLETKIRGFGWHVSRCNGHDYAALQAAFTEMDRIQDKPKFLICDTIKGRGVSFMEHPRALEENGGYYRWHAGAPDDESFNKAYLEIRGRVENEFKNYKLGPVAYKAVEPPVKGQSGVSTEFLAVEYGKALVRRAKTDEKFVVLDADLSLDCKLREFEDQYPKRFIECGIAEQDMVSMGAGLALHGLYPVINSFANFLAARANEQMYNFLTETPRALFACHFAGLLPAGPGKSHQSLRDISLFGAFPNVEIFHPGTAQEVSLFVDYAMETAKGSAMMRIPVGPSPRLISSSSGFKLKQGVGTRLTEGSTVLFAYGPVMLNEALGAAESLAKKGFNLRVVNMPWLNRFDKSWLESELKDVKHAFVLEDHSEVGGLGDRMLAYLNAESTLLKNMKFSIRGTSTYPACGTPAEALSFHKLDSASLVQWVEETTKS